MFVLYEQGPDDRSTYAECFGRDGGPGRKIADSSTMAGLIGAVDRIGHNNFLVAGNGRCVYGRDFYKLPTVAAAIRAGRNAGDPLRHRRLHERQLNDTN